jgi:hypothetical protein
VFGWLERSPPFTLSLSLHVIALLVLALIVIRQPRLQRPQLELVFGPEAGVGPAPAAEGLAIEPADDAKDDDEAAVSEPTPEPEAVAKEPASTPEMKPEPTDTVFDVPRDDPIRPVAAAAQASAAGPPAVRLTLSGRSSDRREALLATGGGGEETEAAVALALEWLVRNQEKSGLWSLRGPYLDGSRQENRLAATAMALLALQGAGQTTEGGSHADAVRRAWKALLARQLPDGTFDVGEIPEQQAMYAHAQATIALCELAGLTEDVALRPAAQRALDHALAAQMPDGGWKYHPPEPNRPNRGDMSVTGWYMMALKTAEMAGLAVPRGTYDRLTHFLDAVFVSDDKGYGYEIMPHTRSFQVRPALTAEALLCRQYLGWPRDDPRLVAGVELLFREVPRDFEYPDVYTWYYVTQVCHHLGGESWKRWNGWMRATLPAAQVGKGKERGSWNPAHDKWGYSGGRLFMTCLCTCMLEAYYRHLPLHAQP